MIYPNCQTEFLCIIVTEKSRSSEAVLLFSIDLLNKQKLQKDMGEEEMWRTRKTSNKKKPVEKRNKKRNILMQ